MFHPVIQYIKFLFKSSNQHGVHSPFVYNLVTKCFYNKTNYKANKLIFKYKKQLLKNKTKITINHLNTNSLTITQNKTSISKLTKNTGITYKKAKLLYKITNYLDFKNILEIGTSLGIVIQAIHLGNPNTNITTSHDCPNISKFTKNNLKKQNLQDINVISSFFNNQSKTLTSNNYDLIFFNNSLEKDATLNYFKTLLKNTNNNSVFIFNAIHFSKAMTEAWENIKQHPKVTVTIDSYHWGFVFFRKEQAKEHFTIRI